MFDFISIKKMLGSYASELKKLRAEIEALEIEREDVLFSPPAHSDVRAAVVDWIESTRTTYQTKLKQDLGGLVSDRKRTDDPQAFEQWTKSTSFVRPSSTANGLSHSDVDRAICGLFGNVLIQSVDATLDQMEWSQDALTTIERTKRLVALDKKLETLRADEKAFVSAANDVGVNVESVE